MKKSKFSDVQIMGILAERSVEGSPCKKALRPSHRREMAVKAVENRHVSIALACRTFGISGTCYRYERLLSNENAEIADLLMSLTCNRKTWGFGLCFLYLRNVNRHAYQLKNPLLLKISPN